MTAINKWSKTFWIDYGERLLYTLLYAILTLITATTTVDEINWPLLWTAVGTPVVLMAIKGLLANLADPDTGASGLPHPPAPEVNEGGEASFIYGVLVVLAILGTALLITLLL